MFIFRNSRRVFHNSLSLGHYPALALSHISQESEKKWQQQIKVDIF